MSAQDENDPETAEKNSLEFILLIGFITIVKLMSSAKICTIIRIVGIKVGWLCEHKKCLINTRLFAQFIFLPESINLRDQLCHPLRACHRHSRFCFLTLLK